jgi:hypothetical protein
MHRIELGAAPTPGQTTATAEPCPSIIGSEGSE